MMLQPAGYRDLRWPRVAAGAWLALLVTGSALADQTVSRWTLENGLRLTVIHVEGVRDFAAFSYLPLGLAADAAGKAQWSHLIEHLTLRTTGPIQDYRERNGETTEDVLRLDTIVPVERWREALDLHRSWLSGGEFSEESLRAELPRALAEADTTAARLFTHKWAVVAWNQVMRHGLREVSVRDPIREARLEDVEQYRDRHLAIASRVAVCCIGPIPARTLRPVVTEVLGKLEFSARALPPASSPLPEERSLTVPWDLGGSHYLETYPLPGVEHADHAALRVASALLQSRLFMDATLGKHTGAVYCNADLRAPESSWLQISASLRPDGDLETVKERIRQQIDSLEGSAVTAQAPFLARRLAAQIRAPADARAAARSVPAGTPAGLVLANVGLQWGLLEYRLGEARAGLADRLEKVTAEQFRAAVRSWLAPPARRTLLLEPGLED